MPCSDVVQFKPMEWVRSATFNLLFLNLTIAYMLSLAFTSYFAETRDEKGSAIERKTYAWFGLVIPLTSILTSIIIVSISKIWKWLIDYHLVLHQLTGKKGDHGTIL